ncbi:MAG: carboxypeptidase-like regulatory domain-containing protein [Alistipes sp.]|nr:carboxypeptidase-like regulatory domain-containing protein [Alistipes sp.]
MRKFVLFTLLTLFSVTAFAQSGIKGQVVSRNGRSAVGHVAVTIVETGQRVTTDDNGNFIFNDLSSGDYRLSFSAPDFEPLEVMVHVEQNMRDLQTVIIVPSIQGEVMDDSVFAEFDNDSSASDSQALPSSLSSSKDIYNNIASYRFSEMRFNVRGYDSMYQDVYLNGIRFNDAMTGYGPWSLWSGLNDATRNQENSAGLTPTDFGIGGIGGVTNVNARASQMRKGFRVSVSNANQMYRWRAMVSYASGALDNGWSYGFSVSTRQGGNGYVDGIYYNSYGYFASVEKLFGTKHRLALSILGTPQQRGAQQASTQEAYDMFGSNYYNPNVGFQDGKLRNTRVRRTHEPIVMLNYIFDISDKTRLTAATSVRFGFNGYSALTWKDGADPRPDYYRYLPSNYLSQITPEIPGIFQATTDEQIENYVNAAVGAMQVWNGRIDFDRMINSNRREDPSTAEYAKGYRSNYMIEERHTDQIDYNFVATLSHNFNANHRIIGGLKARVNRTEYYSTVKDLLGGDYWLDIDKFAERDKGSDIIAYQNDVDYYNKYGHARVAKEGDKYGYDYYAHIRQAQIWAQYSLTLGGFAMNIGAEGGYSSMWRQGLWRKGLFPNGNDSYGDSEHLNYLTYKAKLALSYRISGAHSFALNAAAIADAPKFAAAFVSPRTRNQSNPGLTTEKIYSAELTYNLNLPYIKARVSGYFTKMNDLSKVISFYDDTQSSFTNFAMSGIDKRYYGVELALNVPIWNGIALQGAMNYGDYRYTSNPNFVQIIDNSAEVELIDKVNWKNFYVESTPQIAVNVGLDYRGSNNWFASVNFNFYDKLYLSMNPAYRTNNAVKAYTYVLANEAASDEAKVWALTNINNVRRQEYLGHAYTLSASVGKNWYIHRKYMLGFSAEVKNILNNQNIKTGGYEQMRMRRSRGWDGSLSGSNPAEAFYTRFDSKYFYMLGTTYFLNVYFRF